jgi:hypothetical protein
MQDYHTYTSLKSLPYRDILQRQLGYRVSLSVNELMAIGAVFLQDLDLQNGTLPYEDIN